MDRTGLSIFSALLPHAAESALLRACLHHGEDARSGWRLWRDERTAAGSDIRNELANRRSVLPLLARSATRNEIDVSRGILDYLRAITLREELRASRYRRILAAVLAALEENDVTALVSRGPALAATVYDDWSLRHCHDIDLLVSEREFGRAIRALDGVGLRRATRISARRTDAFAEHASGLPIVLHTRPFGFPFYGSSVEGFATSSSRIPIDDAWMCVPSAEAILVHVLGHSTYSPRRGTLRWVTDAWQIVSRRADLDWENVISRIAEYRLEVPVSVLLDYLARLGLSMPSSVVDRVRERALRADRAALDAAFGGLMAAAGRDVGSIWRSTPSWQGRLRWARWALAPSPAYLRVALRKPADRSIAPAYIYRPARFVGRLLRKLRSERAYIRDELRKVRVDR